MLVLAYEAPCQQEAAMTKARGSYEQMEYGEVIFQVACSPFLVLSPDCQAAY